LKKNLDLKLRDGGAYDEKGRVFGYPSEVELDVAMKDYINRSSISRKGIRYI